MKTYALGEVQARTFIIKKIILKNGCFSVLDFPYEEIYKYYES